MVNRNVYERKNTICDEFSSSFRKTNNSRPYFSFLLTPYVTKAYCYL